MYKTIITEIKDNLSKDNDENKKYLTEQLYKYQNHEYSTEIVREISRLLWDCLSDEEKDEFINITNEEQPIRDIINEVHQDMQNNNFELAVSKLDKFLDNGNLIFYEDDSVTEYHHFSNPIEEILFHETVTSTKRIVSLPFEKNFSGLYHIYGLLLYEVGRIDDAKKALLEAKRFNPVSSQILLRLADFSKEDGDFEKWFEINNFTFDYVYYARDLSQIYRNFAYYYLIKGNKELGGALLEFSEIYEPNVSEEKFKMIYDKHYKFLMDNDIPTEANPLVLKILMELSEDAESNNVLNLALNFYNLYYELTKDSKIKSKLNELKERLN